MSDDGDYAITIIAFVGSVFSPYYKWSGRRDPLNHCAINVALYGKRGARWTMTERPATAVARDADVFSVGPSQAAWDGDDLVLTLDEIGCPLPKRVRGTIRITPSALPSRSFAIDAKGRHTWQPIAPHGRISVNLNEPDLTWSGTAYVDSNSGEEPLEDGFAYWTWSRAHRSDGCTILYETFLRDGGSGLFGVRTDVSGNCHDLEPPPSCDLPTTSWGIRRVAHSDVKPEVNATLENTPFYARSLITAQISGERLQAMHESLDLNRFRAGWVHALLPFRMPRRIF